MWLALVALAACSGDDDKNVSVIDLAKKGAGTCIDAPPTLGPEVKKIPTVDCAVKHTHEIYAVLPYVVQEPGKPDAKATVFPGLEALDAFAQRACITEFEPYVGVSAFDSSLTFSWLTPTLASWNGTAKDRSIICVLGMFNGQPMTGSKKSTKI
ncbi:MAG: septum formation family protein [Ilumatobacteraceae bacterium]